jgi:hypothetical protein
MIDLEDMQRGGGIAIGKRIESGAEDDVLGDTGGEGGLQRVLGIAVAAGEERADRGEPGILQGAGGRYDGNGEGVFKDERAVLQLMLRAIGSRAEGCEAG